MNIIFQKLTNIVPPWLKNRYLISAVFFFIWISFFDSNSFLNQIKKKNEIHNIKNNIQYYKKEIKKDQALIQLLSSDTLTPELEKFFREELFLSKNNQK